MNGERTTEGLPFGVAGSLALHLLPLLALVSWASAPPDIPEAIPVQLVLETAARPGPATSPAAARPARLGRYGTHDR